MARAMKAFRQWQLSNVEGTPGSAEAAVEIGYGVVTAPYSDLLIHYPEQDRNNLMRHLADDFVVQNEVEGSVEMEVNTRHMVWAFSNAIRGNVTPTQPAATAQPNAYLWTWEPGITTANTPDITNGIDTFTLEYGDNVQGYEAEFIFCRTLTITHTPGEPVMCTWDWTARQVSEATFTGALTAQTVQYFPSNLAKFYVDTSWANLGTTQKTGLLRGFTWTLETMFVPRYGADGALYFTGLSEDRKFVELELNYYRDDTESESEKDKYDARTTTYLRLALFGATELDSGQSNPPYIYLDGAYRYTDWPEAGDEDGHVVETVTAQSVYDATGAKSFSVKMLTELDAYPA